MIRGCQREAIRLISSEVVQETDWILGGELGDLMDPGDFLRRQLDAYSLWHGLDVLYGLHSDDGEHINRLREKVSKCLRVSQCDV